jgi:hypothetical protein
MIAVCFVGCGKKTDEEAADEISDKASDSAMTLAMYLLCDEEISPEQAQKIETAVNKITKSKFKTQLKLYFYTADKYYEALEASFAARAAAEEFLVSAEITVKATEDCRYNMKNLANILTKKLFLIKTSI